MLGNVRYTEGVKLFSKQNLIFFFIVILAFLLRFFNYVQFPVGGETADESAWTFFGASIIQTGQPTSWSYFAPYEKGYIYEERKSEAPLVRPALDHPPLFALIPGMAHTLKNSWDTFPSLKLIRLPMVLIGTINVGLLLILARKYFKKKKWVYLSGLIYATAPSFVLTSRLVVAENLLITWTLLALIFLRPEKWRWSHLALLIIGALAVLTKVSGLVVPISILIYGLSIGKKKTAMSGLWGLIFGVVLFALWGAYFNWQLFIDVLLGQAGRDLGLATLHNRFFLHPSIVEKLFFDGWIILGLFSVFTSVYKNKNTFLALNIFVVMNLFFILATSGEQTFHAWYDYMLYPLFVIVIVDNLKRVFKKNNLLKFSLMWLLLLPLLRVVITHLNIVDKFSPLMMRAVMGIGLIPLLISLILGEKIGDKISKKIMIGIIALVLILNVIAVLSFNQTTYWESDSFFYYR